MIHLFSRVLSMSLSASVVICAVLLARLLLSRAPKKWSYLLWAAVGFRLCCPVSLRSVVSLFSVVPDSAGMFRSVSGTGTRAALPPQAERVLSAPVFAERNAGIDWLSLGTVLWIVGAVIMLLYCMIRYVQLRRLLVSAVRMEPGVWASDQIVSPFALGLFEPRIYLPFGVSDAVCRYVLAHERYHLRRGDLWIKTFAYLLLCVHWFNPLCWLAFFFLNRDMELSCDEYVLSRLGGGENYSLSLLSFVGAERFPSPGALAFGESDLSRRVKNALRWKKPGVWMTVAAIALCAVVVAACATNPNVQQSSLIPEGGSLTDSLEPALDRMRQLTDADFESVLTTHEIPSDGLAKILHHAADHVVAGERTGLQWSYDLEVVLRQRSAEDGFGQFFFQAWTEDDPVLISYSDGNAYRTEFFVEDDDLYWFIRNAFHFEKSVDQAALSEWESTLDAYIRSQGIDTSVYGDYEICYFQKDTEHSFALNGDRYDLYHWSARFAPEEPRRVVVAGGAVMDDELCVHGLIQETILAVKNGQETRFLLYSTPLELPDAGRQAVIDAFD